MKRFETIVIGSRQAGLSVSHHLRKEDHDHIVLERVTEAASAWKNHRWDSFMLNRPTDLQRRAALDRNLTTNQRSL